MSIPVYILKRILVSIPTIVLVSMIAFLLMRYDFSFIRFKIGLPGPDNDIVVQGPKNPIDPLAQHRLNPAMTAEAIKKEEERLGLNQPLHIQYWRWVANAVGVNPEIADPAFWQAGDDLPAENAAEPEPVFHPPDFGKTYTGDDVTTILWDRAQNTIILNVFVILFSWLIALPLGVYAALHWRSVTDRGMTALAAVGMSFPSFVLAIILAVLAVKTGILPVGGLQSPNYDMLGPVEKIIDRAGYLILPVFVLTIASLAGIQRQMRGNLLDVLHAEYVRTARAKGLPENKVIYKHAVRTAINPLITMFGYEFSALLGGAVLIETVFNYPGLGLLTYKAVLQTDVNLVMASLLMSTLILIIGNLIADILLKFADPRIELS